MAAQWGIISVAMVMFDIDEGQKIEFIYPENAALSQESQKLIAYLALPHTNNYKQGDTQYCFRYRTDTHVELLDRDAMNEFNYGFVLFRQRKDDSCARGFFQKSVVLITTTPFVGLYEDVMRVVGPLVFELGYSTVESIYADIEEWSAPQPSASSTLEIAGTQIKYLVPSLEHLKRVSRGQVSRPSLGEAPSLADIFRSSQHECIPQSVGLFPSFVGIEPCLWQIWQLAILGESLLVAAPNARVCSQAVLAFISIIDPLRFRGDYRPYFTLYDPDFQCLSTHHDTKNQDIPTTIIGTTDPFFFKALTRWPNALILGSDCQSQDKTSFVTKKIKKKAALGEYDLCDAASKLITRRACLVKPDTALLRKLFTTTANGDHTSEANEMPQMSINNAVMKKYFQQLTRSFLRPFDKYFGIWNGRSGSFQAGLYAQTSDLLLSFDSTEFLNELGPDDIGVEFKTGNWKKLYRRFLESPHFWPWFEHKRSECTTDFDGVLKLMRLNADHSNLICAMDGSKLGDRDLRKLRERIHTAIQYEDQSISPDESYIKVMQEHFDIVGIEISQL